MIKHLNSGKCVDDTGAHGEGKFYHLWDCNNSNRNQIFVFERPSKHQIVGQNNLCLTFGGFNGKVKQQGCNSKNNLQFWSAKFILDRMVLVNHIGQVLDNTGSHSKNGNPIITYNAHYSRNQQFYIERLGKKKDRKFAIVDSLYGKCVDARNGMTYELQDCNGGASQTFSYR